MRPRRRAGRPRREHLTPPSVVIGRTEPDSLSLHTCNVIRLVLVNVQHQNVKPLAAITIHHYCSSQNRLVANALEVVGELGNNNVALAGRRALVLGDNDGLHCGDDEDAALLSGQPLLFVIYLYTLVLTPFRPMTSSGFAWMVMNLKPLRVMPSAVWSVSALTSVCSHTPHSPRTVSGFSKAVLVRKSCSFWLSCDSCQQEQGQ